MSSGVLDLYLGIAALAVIVSGLPDLLVARRYLDWKVQTVSRSKDHAGWWVSVIGMGIMLGLALTG